jgi:hypothetical protein
MIPEGRAFNVADNLPALLDMIPEKLENRLSTKKFPDKCGTRNFAVFVFNSLITYIADLPNYCSMSKIAISAKNLHPYF